jgi:putative transposase
VAWVAQQARNVCLEFAEAGHKPTILMHDRDTKFTRQSGEIFQSEGIEVRKNPPASPNLNAYVERFVQSIKSEALDYVIACGERHLNHIVSCYVDYYNTQRPHQGLDNRPLALAEPSTECESIAPAEVVRREWLGGLLKHYERRAA